MQKQVSKQSLAVLALSILLAISMALTATFAAFTKSATINGTITFTDGLVFTVTSNGSTEVEADDESASGDDFGTFTLSATYEIDSTDTDFLDVNFTMSASEARYWKVVVTFTDTDGQIGAEKAIVLTAGASASIDTTTGLVVTYKPEDKTAANIAISLEDIVTATIDANDDSFTGGNITFSVAVTLSTTTIA